MLKNKKLIYSCIFLLLFTVIGVSMTLFHEDSTSDKNTVSLGNEEPVITDIQSSHVDALYIDMTNSIKELAEQSVLIIEGTVVDQHEYTGISTISTVKISKSIKGISNNEIKILQLNGDNVLEKEIPYVLILGKQSDLENTYYIQGGTQGIFYEKDGEFTFADEVMKKDFRKVKTLKENNVNIKDDKNLLIEYLKEII